MNKQLLIFLAFFLIGFNLLAQELSKEELKNMSKEERKEYKNKLLLEKKIKTLALLNSKKWILDANQLKTEDGKTRTVEPHLNFISINDNKATMQLGTTTADGPNGVGGITFEGDVLTYDLNEGKKPTSPMYLKMEMMGGQIGHVTVIVSIMPDGNATAELSFMRGGKFTYRGNIVPVSESAAFKGQAIY